MKRQSMFAVCFYPYFHVLLSILLFFSVACTSSSSDSNGKNSDPAQGTSTETNTDSQKDATETDTDTGVSDLDDDKGCFGILCDTESFQIQGIVADGFAISGASIDVLQVNQNAQVSVATTDETGAYSLNLENTNFPLLLRAVKGDIIMMGAVLEEGNGKQVQHINPVTTAVVNTLVELPAGHDTLTIEEMQALTGYIIQGRNLAESLIGSPDGFELFNEDPSFAARVTDDESVVPSEADIFFDTLREYAIDRGQTLSELLDQHTTPQAAPITEDLHFQVLFASNLALLGVASEANSTFIPESQKALFQAVLQSMEATRSDAIRLGVAGRLSQKSVLRTLSVLVVGALAPREEALQASAQIEIVEGLPDIFVNRIVNAVQSAQFLFDDETTVLTIAENAAVQAGYAMSIFGAQHDLFKDAEVQRQLRELFSSVSTTISQEIENAENISDALSKTTTDVHNIVITTVLSILDDSAVEEKLKEELSEFETEEEVPELDVADDEVIASDDEVFCQIPERVTLRYGDERESQSLMIGLATPPAPGRPYPAAPQGLQIFEKVLSWEHPKAGKMQGYTVLQCGEGTRFEWKNAIDTAASRERTVSHEQDIYVVIPYQNMAKRFAENQIPYNCLPIETGYQCHGDYAVINQ